MLSLLVLSTILKIDCSPAFILADPLRLDVLYGSIPPSPPLPHPPAPRPPPPKPPAPRPPPSPRPKSIRGV